MSKPLKSPVWEFFEKIDGNKVRCKFCGPPFTDLAFHGGTMPMQNHLVSKDPNKVSEGSQRTLDDS